jgi:hypothetical protein
LTSLYSFDLGIEQVDPDGIYARMVRMLGAPPPPPEPEPLPEMAPPAPVWEPPPPAPSPIVPPQFAPIAPYNPGPSPDMFAYTPERGSAFGPFEGIVEAATTPIPELQAVQEAAGYLGGAAGSFIPGLEDVGIDFGQPTMEQVGQFAAEAAIPTTPAEVTLELSPLGFAGDLRRGASALMRPSGGGLLDNGFRAGIAPGDDSLRRAVQETAPALETPSAPSTSIVEASTQVSPSPGPAPVPSLSSPAPSPSLSRLTNRQLNQANALVADAGKLSDEGREVLYDYIGRADPEQAADLYARSGLEPRPVLRQDFGDDPNVQAITQIIRDAQPLGVQRAEELSRERSRRVAIGASIRGKAGLSPTEAARAARGAQAGKINRPLFEPPSERLGPEVLDGLHRIINESPLRELEKVNAGGVLDDLWQGDVALTPSELRLMGRLLGEDFVDAVLVQAGKVGPSAGEWADALLNASRVQQTAQDLSAPLRQGRFFLATRPQETVMAAKRMVTSAWSDDAARALDKELALHPMRRLADEAGVYLPDVSGRFGRLSEQEEVFLNNLLGPLEKITAPSQRGYNAFLATERMEVFSQMATDLMKRGIDTPDNLKLIGDFVNAGTGRGRLPTGTEMNKWLGRIFYAPRLTSSRPDLLVLLGEALAGRRGAGARNFLVREMGKDFGGYVGSQLLPLTLLKMATGGARAGRADVSVEFDPRSTDFGKVRVGDTRVDLWGGAQPLIRSIAQAVTGERKDATGRVVDADVLKTLANYGRSRLAPTPGLAVDLAVGKNVVGEERGLNQWENILFEQYSPLFFQGVAEGLGIAPAEETPGRPEAGSPLAGALAGLSFFGAGVTTYGPTAGETRDELSREMFKGKRFEQLLPSQQEDVRAEQETRYGKPEPSTAFGQATARIRDEHQAGIQQAADAWLSGNLSVRLGDRISELNKEKAFKSEQAGRDFAETIENFPTDAFDKAVSGFYDIEMQYADGSYDFEGTEKAREAYLRTLPTERPVKGGPTLQQYVRDYLTVVEERQPRIVQQYRDFQDAREKAGYFAPEADTEALDEANPELDYQGWRFNGGVVEPATGKRENPALQTKEAVALALDDPLSDSRDVKFAGLSRPVNQSEGVEQAWNEFGDWVVEYQALPASQRTKALEKVPLLNAYLSYMGWTGKLHTRQAGAELQKLMDTYGSEPPEEGWKPAYAADVR